MYEEGKRGAWYDVGLQVLGVVVLEGMLDEIVVGAMAILAYHRRQIKIV